MLQKLLEYQASDKKLRDIKSEVNSSECAKTLSKSKKFLTSVDSMVAKLDSLSLQVLTDYEAVKETYNENEGQISKYADMIGECEDEKELDYLSNKVNVLAVLVKELKAKLEKIEKKMNDVRAKYNELKQNTKQAQVEYNESRVKYEELKNERLAEISKIEEDMKKLEKDIDKEILTKYNTLKKDIFPVIVKLNGDSCSGCGMQLPQSSMGDLKVKNVIQCSECGRMIYKED